VRFGRIASIEGVVFSIGERFAPSIAADVPGRAEAFPPPVEVDPPPEDFPGDVEKPPSVPKAIPPADDETIPSAPSAVFDSDEALVSDPDEVSFPDDPCMARAGACENVARAGPGARTGMSDAFVPSCSDALPSKSILKGRNEWRYKYAKFHCHKQIV
jgi:hypothetical protein